MIYGKVNRYLEKTSWMQSLKVIEVGMMFDFWRECIIIEK